MNVRQILTPDMALPVPVAAGETVALPAGRGWGTRATWPDNPRWEQVNG